MSTQAQAKAPALIEVAQDLEAIRLGAAHVGLTCETAAERCARYGVPSNGKNAFFRTYSNTHLSTDELKQKMLQAYNGHQIEGFNAVAVISVAGNPRAYEAAIVETPEGLRLTQDLFMGGQGLGQAIMSRECLAQTGGQCHGDTYPDGAYGRIAQARRIGRLLLDAQASGMLLEPAGTGEDGSVLLRANAGQLGHAASAHIDLKVNDTGGLFSEAQGFEGVGCKEAMDVLLNRLHVTPDLVHDKAEVGVESIREQVALGS